MYTHPLLLSDSFYISRIFVLFSSHGLYYMVSDFEILSEIIHTHFFLSLSSRSLTVLFSPYLNTHASNPYILLPTSSKHHSQTIYAPFWWWSRFNISILLLLLLLDIFFFLVFHFHFIPLFYAFFVGVSHTTNSTQNNLSHFYFQMNTNSFVYRNKMKKQKKKTPK